MSADLWRSRPLDPATVSAVAAELPRLAEEIVAAVRAASPAYAGVLSAPEGIGIRLGIEQAIRSFLEAVQAGRPPAGETEELWRRLGEAEFQAGRGLDELRSAFRTGIRAAWRGAADVALAAGIPAATAISMAEAIFTYADALASDVVEGWVQAASDEAGERERRRARLAHLLLDPAGHEPEAVARAAELAGWPLPRALAAVALEAESPSLVARRLDGGVLTGADAGGAWLLLPDPEGPGRRAQLAAALEGRRAALGPVVALAPTLAPAACSLSLAWARRLLALVRRGALAGEGLLSAEEHLLDLVLLGDEPLAGALTRRALAPLEGLPALERQRLEATLRAWLEHQRHTPRVAAALHVHPQTVRYRMARLRELLGDELETPRGRLELELGLRIRAAYSATGGG